MLGLLEVCTYAQQHSVFDLSVLYTYVRTYVCMYVCMYVRPNIYDYPYKLVHTSNFEWLMNCKNFCNVIQSSKFQQMPLLIQFEIYCYCIDLSQLKL